MSGATLSGNKWILEDILKERVIQLSEEGNYILVRSVFVDLFESLYSLHSLNKVGEW